MSNLYDCAHGWHDNDGDDVCTRCGANLNEDPPMLLAELKLFAIRARTQGNWDSPALVAFGEPACVPNLADSILNILATTPSDADFARATAELDASCHAD